MHQKIIVTFAVATFIAVVGSLLALNDMRRRVLSVEEDTSRIDQRTAEAEAAARKPARRAAGSDASELLEGKSVEQKIDWIVQKLSQIEEDQYDVSTELLQDLMALKREQGKVRHGLRRVIEGMTQGGVLRPNLPKLGEALTAEQRKRYMGEATARGIEVEEGQVTVRGFLNLSPRRNMPIEFFMTRFPDSGHETAVHLVGENDPEEVATDPYRALKGLVTHLYKAMLVAGFEQGQHSFVERVEGQQDPRFVLAKGEPVYLYLRYEHEGATHIMRATDWVLDPSTGKVLPHDCLRFSGSMRYEDPDTGEEILASETSGLVVSVWPNPRALVEVSLESALKNNYQYNWKRMPKVDKTLFIDLIFRRTPMDVTIDASEDRLDSNQPIAEGTGRTEEQSAPK